MKKLHKLFSPGFASVLLLYLMLSPVLAEGETEPNAVAVATASDIILIVDALNANGGSETILLEEDITFPDNGSLSLSDGELTILGNGHALKSTIFLTGTAVLNLGSADYKATLTVSSSRSDFGVLDVTDTAVLNIYDGVTIKGGTSSGSTVIGSAGCVAAHLKAAVTMYGGLMTDGRSAAVSGGIYLDGNAVFTMYDGKITLCEGANGGAVGLSGGRPLGGSDAGMSSFIMNGGIISDCKDYYYGGGAVCSLSEYSVKCIISGGTITGCSGESYGMGGALFLYGGSDSVFELNSGTITGNSGVYGGGVMLYKGNLTVADGFGLYGNTASLIGDDIYNNGGSLTLGQVKSDATLACGHKITGWFIDEDPRWSYQSCTGEDNCLVPFEHVGEQYAGDYCLKAAHGRLYTVIWKNFDDTVLETDTDVPEGSMPEYNGNEPVKPATPQYTYAFTGWTPTVSEVTNDITYTAVYSETANTYTVTWINDDETVLESDENVPYGETPKYDGDTPVKAATAQYTYTFTGWTPTISEVTKNITYKAVYSETVNDYTVTWVNDDESVLETDEDVPYGETPKYDGDTPVKAATAQYTYTFKGWTPNVSEVTGDATYKAVYSETLNTYTVTWLNDDGMVLRTDENVPYGTVPKFEGETPVKAATEQYTYTFTGWTTTISEVTGDVSYKAVFAETPVEKPQEQPKEEPAESPKTGDVLPVGIRIYTAVLSLLCMSVVVVLRRKGRCVVR